MYQNALTLPKDQPIFTALTVQEMPVLAKILVKAALIVTRWAEKSRTRRQLEKLPPELRKDVGLSNYQVEIEIRRPFWH